MDVFNLTWYLNINSAKVSFLHLIKFKNTLTSGSTWQPPMYRYDENIKSVFLLWILYFAKQVWIWGWCKELVWRWRCVRDPLLGEIALVGIDVQLVNAMSGVHMIAKTPLGAGYNEEESYKASKSSQIPHHRPHINHFMAQGRIWNRHYVDQILICSLN